MAANALCLAGLIAVGWGLWLLRPAAALIGLGALAIAAGVYLYRQARKAKK